MQPFRGILCPLATPFDHQGRLYVSKLRHNIARLNKTTLTGFVVGGPAGEGALLGEAERWRLFEETTAAADSSKQIIADVSADGVAPAVELAGTAAEQGCGAVIARPPRVGGDSQVVERTALFYRCLGDASRLPVWIDLDRPAMLRPSDGLSLLQHANIAGLLTDAGTAEELLAEGCDAARIAGRRESELLDLWDRDVKTMVLPLANALPFYVLSIEEALRTRDRAAAEELAARAQTAFEKVYEEFGVAGLKHAMDLRGYYGGAPRLPFLPLSPQGKQGVEQAIEGLAS